MAKPKAAAVDPNARRIRELVTPEGVDLRLNLASAGERAGALLLDLAIMAVAVVVVSTLAFFAGLYRIPKADWPARRAAAVAATQLEDWLDKPAETYSGGLKRRLNLAIALINAPRILYLDEPTVGINARSRQTILDAIKITLEKTPPELAADIMDRGIVMSGGGALLRGIDKLVSEETGMPVTVTDEPLLGVVRGTGKALEELETLRKVLVASKKNS